MRCTVVADHAARANFDHAAARNAGLRQADDVVALLCSKREALTGIRDQGGCTYVSSCCLCGSGGSTRLQAELQRGDSRGPQQPSRHSSFDHTKNKLLTHRL